MKLVHRDQSVPPWPVGCTDNDVGDKKEGDEGKRIFASASLDKCSTKNTSPGGHIILPPCCLHWLVFEYERQRCDSHTAHQKSEAAVVES